MNVKLFNSLRPRRNRRHFADDIFKGILLNENVLVLIKISLKFIPKGPINNIPALVQVMVWRRPGDKPLSEPIMVSLLTHICVTQPQWVNMHFLSPNDQKCTDSMTYWQFFYYRPLGNVDIQWERLLKYHSFNSYIYIYRHDPDTDFLYQWATLNIIKLYHLSWVTYYENMSTFPLADYRIIIDNVVDYLYFKQGSCRYEVDPRSVQTDIAPFFAISFNVKKINFFKNKSSTCGVN